MLYQIILPTPKLYMQLQNQHYILREEFYKQLDNYLVNRNSITEAFPHERIQYICSYIPTVLEGNLMQAYKYTHSVRGHSLSI